MKLEARSLNFRYSIASILKSVSFTLDGGELIGLLGPNGVGKTTLLRCLLGFLKPQEGEVLVDDVPIQNYSRRNLAHKLAYIPQSYNPAFSHTVLDTVLMGTTASLDLFESPGEKQINRAYEALGSLGIENLAGRNTMKISGGERQLMLLARALVQDAKILIMDEPTANLDFGNSHLVASKLEELAAQGFTILFSTHDPSMVFRYANRAMCIKDGALLTDGKPRQVLTASLLKGLYNTDVEVADLVLNNREYTICLKL